MLIGISPNIFINDFCKDYIRTFGPKKQTKFPSSDVPMESVFHGFTLSANEYIGGVLNDFDFGIANDAPADVAAQANVMDMSGIS